MSSTNSESVSSLELTAAVPANTDHIDLTAAAKESSSHPSDDESHSTGDDRGIPDLLPVTEDDPASKPGHTVLHSSNWTDATIPLLR